MYIHSKLLFLGAPVLGLMFFFSTLILGSLAALAANRSMSRSQLDSSEKWMHKAIWIVAAAIPLIMAEIIYINVSKIRSIIISAGMIILFFNWYSWAVCIYIRWKHRGKEYRM